MFEKVGLNRVDELCTCSRGRVGPGYEVPRGFFEREFLLKTHGGYLKETFLSSPRMWGGDCRSQQWSQFLSFVGYTDPTP